MFGRAAVTGAICIVQILAMGFFAGDQRGFNLVVGAVSFNAYSYKGLVRNELQGGRTWGCPQQNYMPGTYTQVSFCPSHSSSSKHHQYSMARRESGWDLWRE